MKKVLIIGGGIAGLTLALSLKKLGIPVVIHEKYNHYQNQKTGFLIWSYAIKILQDLGVPVDEVGAPLEAFRIHGRKGRFICEMPIGSVSRLHGANSYEINRYRLSELLSKMVGDDLLLGSECISVSSIEGQAIATFADGSSDQGDILIACDGSNSVVRKFIHPGVQLRMLGSGGWISVIDQRLPLLPLNTQMEFWQPGVKAGVADLGHGETRWYVAFKNYIPSADESKKDQILNRMKPLPEMIMSCLECTDEDQMVPTQAGDLLALSPWYRDRVLMIGDAAHATSPYAGMGACSAIADAALLADLIGSGRSVPAIFQDFQAVRKHAADSVIKESRRGLDLSTCGELKGWVRDWMFMNMPEKKLNQIMTDMVTGH
ncbi:MAG: FAD-dependent monooxygenase [Synechococcus sp. SP2 MAG]|jgi:2-polyprenyl-6-methoxyphenol hydroxylase-like FAD-dependent oxidoreductase|nr:FAD-dependent monooxygenase [Synechococcus sp. SP2 MAG]